MRIANDPSGGSGGSLSDLFRLQSEFYARLAEETMRYLRRLQGAAAPVAPGTVLMPNGAAELRVSGGSGAAVELKLEVENRQRVHSIVTPMLSTLVNASGVTWFPAAEPTPASVLLAPGEVATVSLKLPVPDGLPPGAYRGALLLLGFLEGAINVEVTVARRAGGRGRASQATVKAAPPSGSKSARRARQRRP